MCLEGCMTFCASECSSEAGGGTTSERKSWGIMLNEVEMASRPEWRIMSGFPLVWTPWGSGRRWGRRSGCCDYESQRRESPCSWAVHPQSSCLPFCWTQPCLLQTSLGRWTTRYLRPQHTRMIRQFSVEETKSAKGKAGQAQNKESARFRNTLSFSINLSRRNPTEFLRFRATHLRAI